MLLDEPADEAWMQSLAGELGYGATCFLHGRDLRWFSPARRADVLRPRHAGDRAPAVGARRDRRRAAVLDGVGQLTAHRRGGADRDRPAGAADRAGRRARARRGARRGARRRRPRAARPRRRAMPRPTSCGRSARPRSDRPDRRARRHRDGRRRRRRASIVSRFFAPAAGIPEDSATGSAHCALAGWWAPRLGNRFRSPPAVRARRDDRRGAGGRPRAARVRRRDRAARHAARL